MIEDSTLVEEYLFRSIFMFSLRQSNFVFINHNRGSFERPHFQGE